MSDHLEAAMTQFRQGRRRKYGPYDVTKPPTDEELSGQTPAQREDHSLFSPQQLEQETRTVRLDVSFGDVLKIRDQCEMIIAACRIIMEKTRQHDIGSERQRVDCRREAASLGRALTRFNGKTPYGDTRKRPRSY
jgi:hypothetical protein